MAQQAIVIGSGFAGMSVATFLAHAGWDVTVLEKHDQPGGRARQLKVDGFTFDMGPSWYWMPDVFEHYFNQFGKKVSDYYELKRLDPSYRIYYPNEIIDIPADFEAMKDLFEKIEPGAGKRLDEFMEEAAYKYQVGINKLVYKPGLSLTEFADMDLVKGIFKLDVFASMKTHVRKYFSDPRLRELMEFPVLFLGALPEKIPALYSLMNYADVKLGTWYPVGGMHEIVKAMHRLAEEKGVKFLFNHNVESIQTADETATGVVANETYFAADVVISGADYHFTDTQLLNHHYQGYSEAYWNNRVMAPSCLLYYVGINKRLTNVPHHSLFFDTSFEEHGKEIYEDPKWPTDPLFYVSATTVTDPSGAPEGCENLFFLIPIAAGLADDTDETREKYFQQIIQRFEERIGEPILDSIVYKKSYSVSDFVSDYNAFRGNAYGLANTLMQTAILKPSCRSKKVTNLYYTGQLTVPGPGVPPSLISGEVVAKLVNKQFAKKKQHS
ncbi:phytoene desaturase family protein [Lacibacter sp.]|uniref:phytoene desaturase family protein n=1 Tax=Lacibacter sp. TaxID=1915409 RepID=UPI002B4AD624|nr:phytoene desaturase family protein [Lacibacter sp.]HLP36069.1 phytoene desaturase family protein [Lacibacter sp.]